MRSKNEVTSKKDMSNGRKEEMNEQRKVGIEKGTRSNKREE